VPPFELRWLIFRKTDGLRQERRRRNEGGLLFLTDNIAGIIVSIVQVVLGGTLSLVAATVIRLRQRDEHRRHVEAVKARYGGLLRAVLAGTVEYERGRDALNSICGPDRTRVLEELLLQQKSKRTQVPVLRRLCEELGLVETWQRRLTNEAGNELHADAYAKANSISRRNGRLGSFSRATAARNLGLIRHQPSWPLLAKALDDSSPDVAAVAASSLAAIGEPDSFRALVDRLHSVLLDSAPQLSLRSIKTALVSFPLDQADKLVPSLAHSNGRIRFVAVDIIREIVERGAATDPSFVLDFKTFSPGLAEIFLGPLRLDGNRDVRARAAAVIAHLADPRAKPALLGLLEDAQWPVRLHAVRAFAKPRYIGESSVIARRLTDSHWRVREAAVQTLLTFGQAGLKLLVAQFLISPDQYCREQIVEAIGRAGLITILLEQFGRSVGGEVSPFARKMAQMGKSSDMVAAFMNDSKHAAPVDSWQNPRASQLQGSLPPDESSYEGEELEAALQVEDPGKRDLPH